MPCSNVNFLFVFALICYFVCYEKTLPVVVLLPVWMVAHVIKVLVQAMYVCVLRGIQERIVKPQSVGVAIVFLFSLFVVKYYWGWFDDVVWIFYSLSVHACLSCMFLFVCYFRVCVFFNFSLFLQHLRKHPPLTTIPEYKMHVIILMFNFSGNHPNLYPTLKTSWGHDHVSIFQNPTFYQICQNQIYQTQIFKQCFHNHIAQNN